MNVELSIETLEDLQAYRTARDDYLTLEDDDHYADTSAKRPC